eukprot:1015888-Prymnesium_polylepis.1
MCIRDRLAAARRAASAEDIDVVIGCDPGTRVVHVLTLFGSPSEHGAVSYTHLTLPTICSV